MDIREMVESVVREVVQSIKTEKETRKNGNVLFVFCDSSAHEPFTDQFIKLKNANIAYDILFLDGETSSWLGMQRVESSGSGRIIAADEYSPAAIELPKEYDGIIIPEIDLDNAARVAMGLKGTIKAEIIFSALMLQKFILIGADVPGIKRADRRCLKTLSLPAPYQKRFKNYAEQMNELGVQFELQKDLADKVIEQFSQKIEANAPESLESANEGLQFYEDSLLFRKRLLTAEWIQAQSHIPNNVIYVAKGTIVSPLAKDLLKEKKLTIKIAKRDE
nr:hypothetical protein [Bacillus wudalianchiensis]